MVINPPDMRREERGGEGGREGGWREGPSITHLDVDNSPLHYQHR